MAIVIVYLILVLGCGLISSAENTNEDCKVVKDIFEHFPEFKDLTNETCHSLMEHGVKTILEFKRLQESDFEKKFGLNIAQSRLLQSMWKQVNVSPCENFKDFLGDFPEYKDLTEATCTVLNDNDVKSFNEFQDLQKESFDQLHLSFGQKGIVLHLWEKINSVNSRPATQVPIKSEPSTTQTLSDCDHFNQIFKQFPEHLELTEDTCKHLKENDVKDTVEFRDLQKDDFKLLNLSIGQRAIVFKIWEKINDPNYKSSTGKDKLPAESKRPSNPPQSTKPSPISTNSLPASNNLSPASANPPRSATNPPSPATKPPPPATNLPTPATKPPTPASKPPTAATKPPTPATKPPTPATKPPPPASKQPPPATIPNATLAKAPNVFLTTGTGDSSEKLVIGALVTFAVIFAIFLIYHFRNKMFGDCFNSNDNNKGYKPLSQGQNIEDAMAPDFPRVNIRKKSSSKEY